MKQIKTIQAQKVTAIKRLKVAAYTRVSHTSLLQSLSNQVSHYSQLIQANPEWDYVGVYSDSAISGRSQAYRRDFQQLLEDCRKGKIDLILTKSISRFGRNTVELLETVRELKRLGISVRFEKEKIDTLTAEGELLLTLLASMAQEESQSISQNIRWRVKKRFEEGKPYIPQDIFGYRWNGDEYVIEPHEASIVRQVFEWYMEGLSASKIAKRLDDRGERTRLGNRFTKRVIYNMFDQEAYCGRLILQKTFRDQFGSRSILNDGQMAKYIVENAHEAIVTPEYFQLVNQEKKRRARRRVSKHDALAKLQGKVYCEHCGLDMVLTLETKFNQEKRVRYYCRTRDAKGVETCLGRTVTEEQLFQAFGESINTEDIHHISFNSVTNEAKAIYRNGEEKHVIIQKGR
ncbi:recombinase family protein [Streptococcus agalactiae]|uniref:recombinase family protein n=1 Tax=Streptococcus TaxID=1301 RepID=UPI0005E8B6F0|nr:recombinase family protein [Streptococcus agalactiae]MBP3005495.1 recombinase family protein [Streptococcus agalactiae]MBP3007257.1 recombinase family protein [Streptococcus agalactiae]MBP3012262.1 recombinase family protein [Streptococcus agalactiae]MBP3017605.1 recombinase family protein [Streptococcus agalactiae]MBP3019370.1 recombinase family protein [Streptococcus agalactiae]